ncbi:RICIN domain-containing protein [Flavivirga algicola]|uniref:T9SS type A sorting domain-containing protein n=1 Tax=Flavivirga algicola TaxID=2729136 RepID=A0ABX1RYY7_9FLAO|nr:RICIN domain-containing protein [Flavivirga algicola]NMH88796.1 T9SS type A sorting domain-containing protein [Flavivirga algicola]
MKKTKLSLLLTIMVLTSVIAQPTPPAGKKWVAVPQLTDGVNGEWTSSKWFKPLWNYGEPVQMAAENAQFTNGELRIKATLTGGTRWFKTSRVQSHAQIKYPMYTEARIKTAHISAYNTFWMNNGDINNRDEIDIIENNSKPSCGCQPDFPWTMNSQYFHVINGDVKRAKGNFDNRNLPNGTPGKGVKWNEQFHVVGVWWKDARNIQFYLNGQPAGSVVSARDFTRNLNLIFDLWTNEASWLGGLALRSDLNNNAINTMRIDWVKTWKLENDTGGGSSNIVTMRKGNSTGFSIDGNNGGANNQNVYLWATNSNNVNQQWEEINRGNGFYSYKKRNTNFCLDGGNGGANGQNVKLWTCSNNNQNQHWKKVNLGGGKFRLEKRNAPGYSIDGGNGGANLQNVYLWASNNNNANQHWLFGGSSAKSSRKSPSAESSIEDIDYTENQSFVLYPNPAFNKITLEGIGNSTSEAIIYNLMGYQVKKVKISKKANIIDVSTLASGIYLVKTKQKNGKSISAKFIKK